MSWLARGLGSFGSDLGAGYDISQNWKMRDFQMRMDQARQKMEEAMLPLRLQELQTRIKQMGMPQPVGTLKTPGGGEFGATFDPNIAKYGGNQIFPGMDKEMVRRQIMGMADRATNKDDKDAFLSFADALGGPGEQGLDPQLVLQRALQFAGSSATHAEVTGRLHKGDLVPDKNSVTGYSRQMVDGNGNVVRSIQNVLVPGMEPKVTAGWEKTSDEFGNEFLVPKSTSVTPIIPGLDQQPATRGAGAGVPQPPAARRTAGPQQPGAVPPGAPPQPGAGPGAPDMSKFPRGSRFIGQKSTGPIITSAMKSSDDAANAYKVLQTSRQDYNAAKSGNAKASLALVFNAVRSMVAGAGRMTNVEIEQELKAGSYEQRLERWYQQATAGTMPVDQMDMIMGVIQNAYDGKRSGAQMQWQYAFPGSPLPPWLSPGDIPENAPGRGAPGAPGTPPPGANIVPLDQFLKGGPGPGG